jgi:hypothetical protein
MRHGGGLRGSETPYPQVRQRSHPASPHRFTPCRTDSRLVAQVPHAPHRSGAGRTAPRPCGASPTCAAHPRPVRWPSRRFRERARSRDTINGGQTCTARTRMLVGETARRTTPRPIPHARGSESEPRNGSCRVQPHRFVPHHTDRPPAARLRACAAHLQPVRRTLKLCDRTGGWPVRRPGAGAAHPEAGRPDAERDAARARPHSFPLTAQVQHQPHGVRLVRHSPNLCGTPPTCAAIPVRRIPINAGVGRGRVPLSGGAGPRPAGRAPRRGVRR